MQGEGEAEEAKIIKLEDRAGLLSRNHWTKIIGNNKEMIAKLNRLAILEDRKGQGSTQRILFHVNRLVEMS